MEKPNPHIIAVEKFHYFSGHPIGVVIPETITPELKELIKKRIAWKREELDEMDKALEENNLVGVFDAIADLEYFNNGTVVVLGGQDVYDDIFMAVQEANMSKFDFNEEDAKKTAVSYENIGTPVDTVLKDGIYVTIRKSDGKVMKSLNWAPPEPKIIELLK